MKKLIFVLLSLAFSASASSGYSQDTGTIGRVYVNPNGSIAFILKGGFKNAEQSQQCAGAVWAGVKNVDPIFKSSILAAYTSGKTITVTIQGCENTWYKILDIYLLE